MVRIFNVLILLAFFVAASFAQPALAAKKKKAQSTENQKYASIVIDAETGAILSQSNPDKILHPASLTKLMTLALTFEALEKGTLRPSDRITISRRAAGMSPSKLGLPAGSTIRVQDAIYAVVTKSANDISVALAEAIGGSEANFVRLMNARAASIGMNRTRFRNASGLPDAKQVSTARDMAKLGRHLLYNHAAYYPVFNKKSFTYNGRTYRNHNRLLDSYAGMDGMKTGFVNASGYNLVASAKRGNSRLVAVVFGGRTSQSRNLHMSSLLDRGFEQVDKVRLASSAQHLDSSSLVSASMPDTARPQQQQDQNIVSFQGNALTAADRLTETAPQISSFAQTTNSAATARREQTLGTVRIASLNTANDAHPSAQPPVERPAPLYTPPQQQAAARPEALPAGYAAGGTWSVQVGAFQSRVATDQAIYRAIRELPGDLSSRATPLIVPLRTADASWVFRARLSGFTQAEAERACSRLKDCMTISPQAY